MALYIPAHTPHMHLPHSHPVALISITYIYMPTPPCLTHLDVSYPDEQGSGEAWEKHAYPQVVQTAVWLRHQAGLVLSLEGWVLG